MNNPTKAGLLTNDQRDVLQEVANIGMGLAGEQLANILKQFITLSIPQIRSITPITLAPTIKELIQDDRPFFCIKQAFFNHWRGEAFVFFDKNGCHQLASIMGYEFDEQTQYEVELLLDLANVIVGACVNGLASQLRAELSFNAPSIFAENASADTIFKDSDLNWSEALVVEVHFFVEQLKFSAHLCIVISDETLGNLRSDVDDFLSRL